MVVVLVVVMVLVVLVLELLLELLLVLAVVLVLVFVEPFRRTVCFLFVLARHSDPWLCENCRGFGWFVLVWFGLVWFGLFRQVPFGCIPLSVP